MKKLTLFLLCISAVALSWGTPVDNLHPVVTDTDVSVQVSFDSVTGIYEYRYTIVSGPANAGEIDIFYVEMLTTSLQNNMKDPDLYSDESRFLDQDFNDPTDVPKRTVPVGIQAPYPFIGWLSGVSTDGWIMWGARKDRILPNQSLGGFVLQAKEPPGARRYRIEPNFDYSSGEEGNGGPEPQDFWVTGMTVGPVMPEDLKLINGKGQSAAVNEFLAYSNLTATRTTLSANARGFDLAVKYGNTTIPATFTATLNGVNVTQQFHPNPGAFDVVRIPLAKGTNKLLLSIEGLKPSGAQSRDTGSLTFIVP